MLKIFLVQLQKIHFLTITTIIVMSHRHEVFSLRIKLALFDAV